MEDLIKALQIFLKYDNPNWPTHCEHDELMIVGDYHPDKMEPEDVKKLDELGFNWSESEEYFYSFKYGSA